MQLEYLQGIDDESTESVAELFEGDLPESIQEYVAFVEQTPMQTNNLGNLLSSIKDRVFNTVSDRLAGFVAKMTGLQKDLLDKEVIKQYVQQKGFSTYLADISSKAEAEGYNYGYGFGDGNAQNNNSLDLAEYVGEFVKEGLNNGFFTQEQISAMNTADLQGSKEWFSANRATYNLLTKDQPAYFQSVIDAINTAKNRIAVPVTPVANATSVTEPEKNTSTENLPVLNKIENTDNPKESTPTKESFWQKNKTIILIGSGLIVAGLVAGIIYATRKSKEVSGVLNGVKQVKRKAKRGV